MPPNLDLTALANLRADPRLAVLSKTVPPIRLFRALGVARDEVTHSRLLATLFDPQTHADAEALLRALLARVAARSSTPANVAATIQALPTVWNRIVVCRELYRVDVIVNILAPNGLVVGIENKIDADEGVEQLNRYQDFLRDRFPKRPSVLLFLTPSGRTPLTSASDHLVPCVPISYADVLASVESIRSSATARDSATLELIALHFREEIMGEPDEVRKLMRDLWQDHAHALRLLLAHQPRLSDIEAPYKEGIRQVFPKVEFFNYPPSRGDLIEIQFSVPGWPARLPFTFMLRAQDGQLYARVLIYREHYDQYASSLTKWAASVSATAPQLLDTTFRQIPNWSWRRVLLEEDWPIDSIISATGTDEDIARCAVERIVELVERLRPHVEKSK